MARKPPFRTALDAIERMTDLDQLRELKAAIERRLVALERAKEEWQPPEGTVEVRRTSRGHYALEWVFCGKERCRCAGAKGKEARPVLVLLPLCRGPEVHQDLQRAGGGRRKSVLGNEMGGMAGRLLPKNDG